MDCAIILLERNADLEAVNMEGITAFHKAAEIENFEFGRFLKAKGARPCRSSCKKCRIFVKLMQKKDQTQLDRDKKERQRQVEEQKQNLLDQEDQQLADQLGTLNLDEEIEMARQEMGGPFFDRRQNQVFRRDHPQSSLQNGVIPVQTIQRRQFNRKPSDSPEPEVMKPLRRKNKKSGKQKRCLEETKKPKSREKEEDKWSDERKTPDTL